MTTPYPLAVMLDPDPAQRMTAEELRAALCRLWLPAVRRWPLGRLLLADAIGGANRRESEGGLDPSGAISSGGRFSESNRISPLLESNPASGV